MKGIIRKMADEERRPLLHTRPDSSSASKNIHHVPPRTEDVKNLPGVDHPRPADADNNSVVTPQLISTSGEDKNGIAGAGLTTSGEVGSPPIPPAALPVPGRISVGCPDTSQSSRWGVLCLLLVAFFQSSTSKELIDLVGKKESDIYNLNDHQRRVIQAICGAILYIFPIVAGLISDTLLPRERACVVFLVVKLLGSLLKFVAQVIVYRMDGHLSEKMVQVLLVVNILGVALILVAVCFFPLFISFGAQQVNQEKNAVCSYLRGLLCAVLFGTLTSEGIHMLHITEALPHLSLVVCDVLSVVVFLAAIRKYNRAPTDAGRRRFKEFMQILRAHAPCFFHRTRFDETFNPRSTPARLREIREIQEKRAMDRFHLRKGILLVALLSCGAVAANMIYLTYISTKLTSRLYLQNHVARRMLGYLNGGSNLIFALLILLLEACTRCSQYLRSTVNDNTLRKLGLGSIFAAFSCLLVGLVSTGQLVEGPENVSLYWLCPHFIIGAVGAALILTSVLEIGIFESGPGLATFLCGLGASLSFLSFTAVGLVLTRIDIDTVLSERFDYIYYIAFGVMAFTLLVIYIPVSVWYTGVKTQILSLSLSMRGAENDAEAPILRVRELDVVAS